MDKYRRWILAQLAAVELLDSQDDCDLSELDGLRRIVSEAEQRAAAVGLPAAVQACQIRRGPISTSIARKILATCLASTQSKPPELFTTQQAADFLGLPRRTVNDLCTSGKLRHHRHGNGRGTIRIARADLDAYLADAQVEPYKLNHF